MEGERKGKLVIHWDINGTITAVDSTEHGSEIDNANMVVSKSVFGKVVNGVWVLNDDVCENYESQTYYDYLKSVDKENYKKRSFDFTKPNNPGASLVGLIDKVVATNKNFLFGSFLKAVEEFPDALHVFRTFGQDTNDVLATLRRHHSLKDRFELVSHGKPISVDLIEVDGHVMSFHEFNTLLAQTDRHIFIQENYEYWNTCGRKKEFGKQLVSHEGLTQVFFDDNDCVFVNGQTSNTKFILVNTLSALMDDDYYVGLLNFMK